MDHHPKALAYSLTLMDTLLLKNQPSLQRNGHNDFNQLLNRQSTISTISEHAIAEVPQRPVIKELDKPPTVNETNKAMTSKCIAAKLQARMASPQKCISMVVMNLQQN